ncbi:hypothetical protein EDD37DRAFT_140629 [Exophiala viscosa]|uniref:uncharacterized protein n=1 Tax=Exophiala viscosa TaxID=2486360 RepID=UPI0021978B25|nr:hypothetical protein EDD37DRAFT_140629 [Exophiala viscosa]
MILYLLSALQCCHLQDSVNTMPSSSLSGCGYQASPGNLTSLGMSKRCYPPVPPVTMESSTSKTATSFGAHLRRLMPRRSFRSC